MSQIDEKLDRIADKLDQLIELLSNQQKKSFFPDSPKRYGPGRTTFPVELTQGKVDNYIATQQPCAYDMLPPADRLKPMGLYCSCPKCSAYSLLEKAIS